MILKAVGDNSELSLNELIDSVGVENQERMNDLYKKIDNLENFKEGFTPTFLQKNSAKEGPIPKICTNVCFISACQILGPGPTGSGAVSLHPDVAPRKIIARGNYRFARGNSSMN